MTNVDLLQQPEMIYENNGKSIVKIDNIEPYEQEEYNLLDEKDFIKYIKDIESDVRVSQEYRKAVWYLKNTEGMDTCSFLEGVSSRDNDKIKIEIHHSPLTLFDITLAVIKKRMANREDLSVEGVAEEVAYLHYVGLVGLIPLSTTIHKIVHNNFLFVPVQSVRGNYRGFIELYYQYIAPETLDDIDCIEAASKDDTLVSRQMEILNRHDIYIDANNSYKLLMLEDVRQIVKQRLSIIKGNLIPLCTRIEKK